MDLDWDAVVGYLMAWATTKFRRVARQADTEVDRAVDAGLGQLREMVRRRLGDDPALAQLEREVDEGVDGPRTRERVRLALEDAAERDPEFASEVANVLRQVRAAAGVVAADHGVAAGGDVSIRAYDQAVAAAVIHGAVSTANPPEPGPARP
jgi:hypothetical protein